MSALARERMMCGECVKVSVLVSANFCLCWLVPTFVFTTRVFTRSQGLGFAL